MRVLLDTNIIIHRENKIVTNESIGHLFYWLDKLKYTKLIHGHSINEINKYNDKNTQKLYDVKLSAYEQILSIAPQTEEFLAKLNGAPKTQNDEIDNQLLCELYCGKVDFLITEDRKMRRKANLLGLDAKVFSISSFIEWQTLANPSLVKYKMLAVEKKCFGDVDVNNTFFDSFKKDYEGFEKWFASKCTEEAYICEDDLKTIQGFLYLKVENKEENYSNITPIFEPKKRLKVGTFKVEATGFRLGERFLKIIFDNAIQYKVDEIYVTLFDNRPELKALFDLLERWGFRYYGKKTSNGKTESVLVKKMNYYSNELSVKENFPNIDIDKEKFFLPIYPQFHTRLLPDSKLRTENKLDFMDKTAEKYALEKVYISVSYKRNMNVGDLVLIYRTGEDGSKKAYTSVVSTLGVLTDLKRGFSTKEEFFSHCQNRTVFTTIELEKLWNQYNSKLLVVKFVSVQSLEKRVPLKNLWEADIIERNSGPRPFDPISDLNFNKIIDMSATNLYKR